MTEQKSTPAKAAPKPKAPAKPKTVKADVEAVVADVEKDAKEVVAKVEAEVPVVESEVDSEFEKLVKSLDGKSVFDLRNLHADAILAEDAIKRELHVARLRAANDATTVGDDVDKLIAALKVKVAEAVLWLKAIEAKLDAEVKDIWGTRF